MEIIYKTLTLITEYIPVVITILLFILCGAKIGLAYFDRLKEANIDQILEIVKASVLKLMTDAEIDFSSYKKAGEIKKSQVINNIYKQFPILTKYKDQETLQAEISDIIENEMCKIREFNSKQSE